MADIVTEESQLRGDDPEDGGQDQKPPRVSPPQHRDDHGSQRREDHSEADRIGQRSGTQQAEVADVSGELSIPTALNRNRLLDGATFDG
jgi:hypothetical protein